MIKSNCIRCTRCSFRFFILGNNHIHSSFNKSSVSTNSILLFRFHTFTSQKGANGFKIASSFVSMGQTIFSVSASQDELLFTLLGNPYSLMSCSTTLSGLALARRITSVNASAKSYGRLLSISVSSLYGVHQSTTLNLNANLIYHIKSPACIIKASKFFRNCSAISRV